MHFPHSSHTVFSPELEFKILFAFRMWDCTPWLDKCKELQGNSSEPGLAAGVLPCHFCVSWGCHCKTLILHRLLALLTFDLEQNLSEFGGAG